MGLYATLPTTKNVLATSAGAAGNNSADDTAALQAVLNAGWNLILDAQTFKISASLKKKFQGQYVLGLDERLSILNQVTSTEHGIEVTGNHAVADPKFGGGAFANRIENLTIQLPGTYNAGTGAFSGSTGNAIHFSRSATLGTCTVVAATNVITVSVAHGLLVNDRVQFTSATTLPAPLVANTDYFVITVPSSTTLTISATLGGAVLDITDTGTGTHTIYRSSSYLGDFLSIRDVHTQGANRGCNIDGFGNVNIENLSCEYGNHGLVVSVTSAGAAGSTGNGFVVSGYTQSNNAGSGLWWGNGFGNTALLRDFGTSDVCAGTPIVISNSQVDLIGGNCEGMGTANKIMDLTTAAVVSWSGAIFSKGASVNDGAPIRVAADCRFTHKSCANNGYSAAMIAAVAPSASGAVSGFSNATMTLGGRTVACSPFETVNDNGIPAAGSGNVGKHYRVIDRSGTAPDYEVVSIRNADGSTFSMSPATASAILLTANTFTASQTMAAGKRWNIGAPASGGGLRYIGSSGQYDLATDWERYAVGDWSLNIGAISNGDPTLNMIYVDAVSNRTTIGHKAATQPTGTKTLNIEGTLASTGVFTPLVTIVGSLPSAATAGVGAEAFVTDGNTTLILGLGLAVTGGGANKVPVYSDGTNWIVG